MMAVGAYASMVSLMNMLDNLEHPVRLHHLRLDRILVEALKENVHSLLKFAEVHSQRNVQETDGLWRQIAEVAFLAEDMIDSFVVNQLRREPDEDESPMAILSFCEGMNQVIQRMESFYNELSMMLIEKGADVQAQVQRPKVSALGSSSSPSGSNNIMVGFDEHVTRILKELATDEPNLQIIPIVGMGGIGKTTLAKSVFDHAYIVGHFHVRSWVTISQEYNARDILLNLLYDGKNKENSESLYNLGEKLYKKLYGKKYLIVMDDIWATEAWDDFKLYFPNNRTGSRIIMTSRLSNVTASIGCQNPLEVTFLNKEDSWNLLCQKIFGQKICTRPELEIIGRDIAKSCRGLPLVIVVIGSLLENSNMTQEYWKFVLHNINSFRNLGDDEHCLEILSLSYNSLPISLKPCFLYLKKFSEDETIDVQDLINLWIAEGFIKPVSDKTLEETAEEYVKALVDRSLIFIRSHRVWGKVLTCGMHDLLRDLCMREYKKGYFVRSPKVQQIPWLWNKNSCFLCNKKCKDEGAIDDPNLFYVCQFCTMSYPHPPEKLELVRAMDIVDGRSLEDQLVQSTGLRYVSIEPGRDLKFIFPSTLHLVWNLQTLIFRNWGESLVLPSEIWEMPQLRHLEGNVILRDPVVKQMEGENSIILENLQTIFHIRGFKCIREILDKIPNLKDLKISYPAIQGVDSSNYFLCNLARLQKLETLQVEYALENITFPNSLRKLDLNCCRNILWKDMTIIGSLPNLESLSLNKSTEGSEWNPIEGEFLRLKALRIAGCTLVHWNADQIHFPNLVMLTLERLDELKEVPLGIGDIATLCSIRLEDCGNSVVDSAKQIWEEQQSMGNEGLEISIDGIRMKPHHIGGSGHN